MQLKVIALASAAVAVATPMAQAQAQDRAQDRASVESGDIIVTARKRQESILEVPVVANVLTQDVIAQAQVVNLQDVTQFTPGFVLGQSVLENGAQVSIRGIGTTSLDPGIDQSVSLNIDGMQFTQGSAYSIGLFDMAQVEVLKGPQALFFGKNSPGGVVSIRTADPTSETEVSGTIGYEAYARALRGEAIISTPLTDSLGLRLAAAYSSTEGYFRNRAEGIPALGAVQPPDRLGQGQGVFLRGTLLYENPGSFTARLKLNYSNEYTEGGGPFQYKSCPEGTTNYLPSLGIALPSFFPASEDCRVDRDTGQIYLNPAFYGGLPNDGKPFSRVKQAFATLEMNYNLSPAVVLSSVTGYYDLKSRSLTSGSLFGTYSAFAASKFYHRKDFTQEFRLSSDFDSPFNFLAGAFYQKGDIYDDARLPGNSALGFPASLVAGTFDLDIESVSGFGQLLYKVTPKLELAAGVRYTDERRSIAMTTQYPGLPLLFPTAPDLVSKNWSPEFTVTFTPTDDLTVFGSLKQGYKSGSYNIVQPIAPGEDNSYGDERVRGGEIGIKTRLADRQLNLNLAGYYYNYNGLQVGINQPPEIGGLPVLSTRNAGTARVYGVDFDMSYQPRDVEGLSLRAAVNWNKAKFTSFVGAPCAGGQTFAEGCNLTPRPLDPTADAVALATGNFFTNAATGAPFLYSAQDLSNTPLSRAPEWQASFGIDYELPVGRNMKLRLGTNGQYSSRYLTNLGRRDDFYQDDFFKLGANITLAAEDDSWQVSLIGSNLTNQYTSGLCFNSNNAGGIFFPGGIQGGPSKGPAGSDEIWCSYDNGREVWLRLTLRPGGRR
ncbi:TonB-dependent receptor [Novosphingobium sp. JCM 18896]|uniref:TonB-dependent receptor n=1 Tax=Novosphingobium sp. JCM 18896 TaxID=2989731 RepID=UPI00222137CF|nr:TonB-dependent receptor [Novosphingobium sp. JCM 18896]MCW1427592.1 TonB-dependent receptor [Novosphingobium sp. JCM 18896]